MKVLLIIIVICTFNKITSRRIVQGTKKEPLKAESAFSNNELFHPEYVPIYENEEIEQPHHNNNHQVLGNIQVQDPQIEHNSHQTETNTVHHQRELLLHHLKLMLASDPLLAAAVLSQTLGFSTTGASHGQNHPQHPLPNPYVSLLLSHYGRYLTPHHTSGRNGRGIYGYNAANNLHNNQPFGAYKLYKDVDV